MKHNIRINGQVKEIDCELGSGILDKNGREIFEGDKVAFCGYRSSGYSVVKLRSGTFLAGDCYIANFSDRLLEIVDD